MVIDDSKKSDNVTESDASVGCNKSRDKESERYGLKTWQSPG
jgi:hypothetical protein